MGAESFSNHTRLMNGKPRRVRALLTKRVMKKIMFNDCYGLTQAVLEERKTMTRRIITAPKKMEGKDVYGFAVVRKPGSNEVIEVFATDADGAQINNILPPYKPGEVVAVAQAYRDIPEYNPESYEDVMLDHGTICAASHPYSHLMRSGGWDNKMFVRADLMPHRIRITDVKVERLQDISDEDCLREGIVAGDYDLYGFRNSKHWDTFRTPREAFAALIDKVSGKGTWESNPYVFVYEFELVK